MICPKCKRKHDGTGYLCQYCLEELDLKLQRDALFLSEWAGVGHLIGFITAIIGLIMFLAM